MTEEALAARMRDAVDAVALPPYPRPAVRARLASRAIPEPRARLLPRFAAVIASIAAVGVGASAIAGVPHDLSDKVVAALDKVGIHVKGAHVIEARTVSLDEARQKANFPVIVPANVQIRHADLTVTPGGTTFVGLVLVYDKRSEISLDESLAESDTQRVSRDRGAYQIDSNGTIKLGPAILWTIGKTRLIMLPYDAKSRAFAERVRRETLRAARGARR